METVRANLGAIQNLKVGCAFFPRCKKRGSVIFWVPLFFPTLAVVGAVEILGLELWRPLSWLPGQVSSGAPLMVRNKGFLKSSQRGFSF